MKFLCIIAAVFGSSGAFAADVTLNPNGRVVNINGSTVACVATGSNGVNGAPDDVVIGMAIGDRLGSCTVAKDASGYIHVLLNDGGVAKEVGYYASSVDAANALRGYVNAGACN